MPPTYTIDDDKLTIGDLVKLQKAGNDLVVQIEIMRKAVIVPNGSIEDIPAKHYKAIVLALLNGTGDALGN